MDTPESARDPEAASSRRLSTRSARAQDEAERQAAVADPQVALGDRTRAGALPAPLVPPAPPARPPAPPERSAAERDQPDDPQAELRPPAAAREPSPTEAPPARQPASQQPPAAPARPPASPAEAAELSRAVARGELSYEATQYFFAEYLLGLKHEVEVQWLLALLAGFSSRDAHGAVFEFLVQPDGTVSDLRLVQYEGDALFPGICEQAIRRAAPFDPVPYRVLPGDAGAAEGLPLRIRFGFDYD